MSDIHELIESIRVTLTSSLNYKQDELLELHEQLDGHIRSANKRLRECDSLLANGHRSEAIQLAEQEPNLLELVGYLDLPELLEWNDFVAEYGIKVAPELQIEIATDLNHAYSDDTPLEGLLNRLRVYSIGRSPLRIRIDILRKIAKLDVESPHWQDDLKAYEKLRIRQMTDEIRVAQEAHDYTKLKELQKELTGKKWSVKPKQSLLQRVQGSLKIAQQGESLVRLQSIFQGLSEAKENNDIESAELLAEDWNSTLEKCDHESPEFRRVYQQATPVMRWIEKRYSAQEAEDEKKQKLDKFTRMLRSPRATVEVLENRFETLASSDVDIPAEVEEQYFDKIAELDQLAKRQKMIKFGGIALAVVVVLIGALAAFVF